MIIQLPISTEAPAIDGATSAHSIVVIALMKYREELQLSLSVATTFERVGTTAMLESNIQTIDKIIKNLSAAAVQTVYPQDMLRLDN